MAAETKNYKLVKPEQSDFFDVDTFNGNADRIDTAIKVVDDGLRQLVRRIPRLTITESQWVDRNFTITSELVKEDSICDIYFSSDTVKLAEKAKITGRTAAGQIVLTAGKVPAGSLVIDAIKVVNEYAG